MGMTAAIRLLFRARGTWVALFVALLSLAAPGTARAQATCAIDFSVSYNATNYAHVMSMTSNFDEFSACDPRYVANPGDPASGFSPSPQSGSTANGGSFVTLLNAADDTIRYTAPSGFAGTDTFTVTFCNDAGCSFAALRTATVTVTVGTPTIVVNPATLPAATVAVAYSQTMTGAGGQAPYGGFTVISGALPAGLTLGAGGALTGTPTASGTFNFTIRTTDSTDGTGPFQGSRAYTLTVNAPTITVSPTTVPNATVGVAYSQTLTGGGGTAPYGNFVVTVGALPAGLTLNSSSGAITGTPTSGGAFNFTIRTTDSTTGAGPYNGSRVYSMTVNAPTIAVGPTTLPSGTQSSAYSQTIVATGGTAPRSFAVTAGALPVGLTLAAGGGLTGTPTVNGSFNFTVTATDSSTGSGPYSGSRAYSLVIGAPPAPIANAVSATVAYNSSNNPITLNITGGAAASVAVPNLPTHGIVNIVGTTITYTPTTNYAGPDSFTYTATNPGGTSTAATVTITVATPPAPTVTSLTPSAGPATGGTSVTVTGTNFSGATAVTFGATAATGFTVNSATQITATAPAGTGTIDIRVTTVGGTSATSAADQYTYVGAPTVTSLTPSAGPATGGTSVTVTGTNFSGATAVTFGATAAAGFTVNSATQITATAPAGTGTIDIRVTTVGGTSATSAADQYTYVGAPTVTSVSPSAGPATGGTSVTITGTNFAGSTAVTFGATAASGFTVNSATQITATAPAGTGTIDIRVTTVGGTSATSAADQYTYVGAPTVTSVTPSAGPATGGTSVTVTGTNFSGATAVTFGATAAAGFTVNSATQITATAPAGTGTIDIRVTTVGGISATSAADQYTYVGAPTVTSVSPSAGPATGGTTVTITGTNFAGSTAVTFGATAASGFTVNSATQITATAPSGTGTVDIRVTSVGGTSATSAADQYTYAPTITVLPTTLPNPTVGTAYSQTVTASGGTAPYTFSRTAGALPKGVTLSAGGTLTGTPSEGGSFSFTVQASDSSSSGPFTGTQAYSVTVAAPTIAISPTTLSDGTVGTAYSQALAASGGTAPYTFLPAGGTLPPGLTLSASGDLTGTPTAGGSFSFTVQASDSSTGTGPYSTGRSYTVTIAAPTIMLSPTTLPDATAGAAYSQAITASGGTAPYTYTQPTGTLPAGVTFSAGTLSGTPTETGSFTFTLEATDSSGGASYSGSRAYTLTVGNPQIVMTPTTLPAATAGVAYSQAITASGGTAPYTYTVAYGALPAGLSLSQDGTLSGTPTVTGTLDVPVSATDSTGNGTFSGFMRYALTIGAPTITIAPTTLPAGTVGAAYSQAPAGTGGTAPYAYTISSALPDGLTLSASTGAISGTPTTAGTFNFTLTATDSTTGNGPYADDVAYSIVIAAADTITSLSATPAASVFGQSVILSAAVTNVAPATGAPAGSVIFTGPVGFTLQTVALDSSGVAELISTALPAGSYAASYIYSDDYNGSSDTVSITVGQAATTTAFVISPNPSVTGELVDLIATVSATAPGGGIPAGTVSFENTAGVIGTATVDGTGEARLASQALPGGTITATYSGSDDHQTSDAQTLLSRTAAATTTTVSASPNPSVSGQSVTFTATVAPVAPGTGTPTGNVTFTWGNSAFSETVPLSLGVATMSTSLLTDDTVVATYDGVTGYGSSSGQVGVTVGQASTTTSVTATPDPSVSGQAVTLTATVSATSPGSGTPSGSVTFIGPNGLNLSVTLASGVATMTTTVLETGTISTQYSGDARYLASSGTTDVTVGKAATSTLVTATPDPSVSGQSITLSATVAAVAPGSGVPAGTVTFTGPGGLNQVVALDSVGVAEVTSDTLPSGTYAASYSATTTYTASSGDVTVTVDKAATTTTVTASPDPSVSGEFIEINAVVTIVAPGSGSPSGTVTFTGPGGLNQTIVVVAGVANFAYNAFATGTVTATYNGDALATGSSGTVDITVDKADTTISAVATPNPSVTGQRVDVSVVVAPVAPGTGTPTGTVTFTGPDGLIATTSLLNGQTSFDSFGFTAGTLTVAYSGDGGFAASTGDVTLAIDAAPTLTSLAIVPNPSVSGETVVFTATVTVTGGGGGIPAGNVTFSDSSGLLGTATLGSGVATFASATAPSGVITAAYAGSAEHVASDGSATLTRDAATTTTSVVASPDPSVSGESVTLSATVAIFAPGTGVATGTVTFSGAGGLNVTVALDSAGMAAATATTLATGTITATYNGDALVTGSSGTVGITVDPAATTTAVTATPDPSVSGESVTLSATVALVAPGTGIATGTVTFTGPGGFNQTVALDGTGLATLTSTALATGTITATYNGDALATGSSGTVDITVGQATTTTSVVASPDPSVSGESVTLSATVAIVAPGTGIATGTVTFTGPGGLNETVVLDSAGMAAVTATTLATGTVTATYNGDALATGSSGTVAVTVDPAATTTAVTATPDPSVSGESVALSATVAIVAPGTGIATGTVTFTGPGGLNETVALDSAGMAAVTATTLATGTITATYNGDALVTGSSGTVGITVDPAATTTAVTATPDPSVSGESVTLSATVALVAPGTGIATGTVTFTGPGGFNQTVALDGTGLAALTSTALATGTITATYNGDALATGSSGTVDITVGQATTTTSVVASPDPSVSGESVTLSATVAIVAPGTGSATGTVTFTGPGGLNQTVALDGTGMAAVTATTLATGTVTATYNGDALATGSSATTDITVGPATTTTSVVASPDPSVSGESVTLSATVAIVAPGTGIATGTVTFTGRGGLNQTVALDGTGLAALTTTVLATGTVTATYNGDGGHAASSGTVGVTVGAGTTDTSVDITPNPSVAGQTVTMTATVSVTPPGSGTPTGTVTFTGPGGFSETVTLVDGVASLTTVALASGTFSATYNGDGIHAGSIGTMPVIVTPAATTTSVTATPDPIVSGASVTLSATVAATTADSVSPTGTVTFTGPGGLNQAVALDGSGLAALVSTTLTSGTITATYDGDGIYPGSAGSVSITVNAGVSDTTISASPSVSAIGEQVTLTATVNATGGDVTAGTVSFYDGADLLDTVPVSGGPLAGTASVSTAFATDGTRTLTASFNGTGLVAASSGTTQQTVQTQGSIAVRMLVDGPDTTFGFTSPTAELNLSVTTTGGSGQSAPVSLAAGRYVLSVNDMTAQGYGIAAISCTDTDGSVDVAGRTASIELSAGEAVVCTFTSTSSQERTTEMIEGFLETRGDLIMSNQPDTQRRIDRLTGAMPTIGNPLSAVMGYLPVQRTAQSDSTADGKSRRVSVSTSLGAVRTLAGDQKQSDFDVWFDATYAGVSGDASDGSFGMATVGADYLINKDLLVGGFVQIDRMTQSFDTDSASVEGTGWLAGPYMTTRLTEHLFLDVLAGAGTSSNLISPFGTYEDSFDATRWLVSGTLQGQWTMDAWTFTPKVRLSYFSETSGAYVDGLGVSIPSVDAGLGQFAAGPGFLYRFQTESMIAVEAGMRFDGIVDIVDNATDTGFGDLRGRIEGSLDFAMPGGARIGITTAYDGIGSDLNSTSGKLHLSIPLN
jgi:hypothetical protein